MTYIQCDACGTSWRASAIPVHTFCGRPCTPDVHAVDPSDLPVDVREPATRVVLDASGRVLGTETPTAPDYLAYLAAWPARDPRD